MKPLIKYAGGKAALAPAISAAFGGPCPGTFHDVFGGSGAVTLHRRAAGEVTRAVLSDLDPWLVTMHRGVRDEPGYVSGRLEVYRGMTWDADAYGHERAVLNERGGDAARFIAVNRACFNGLYRKSASGEFNTSWGKQPHPRGIPSDEHVATVSALLAGVQIECADAVTVIAQAGAGDHVYADPPYVGTWTGYGQGGTYEMDDLRRLIAACVSASDRGARVVLSHADDAEPDPSALVAAPGMVRAMLDGWHIDRIDARGSISCTAGGRGARREILASIGPILSPRSPS